MIRRDLPVRPADALWLGLAVLFALAGVLGLYAWARDAVATTSDLASLSLVLLGLVLLLASAGWLIAVSWRRTCWGAPPGSRRERRERHRAAGE